MFNVCKKAAPYSQKMLNLTDLSTVNTFVSLPTKWYLFYSVKSFLTQHKFTTVCGILSGYFVSFPEDFFTVTEKVEGEKKLNKHDVQGKN